MIANLSNPIAALRGALSLGSEYYARVYRGKCVIQRKPNRKGHVPTAEEAANQKRFIEKYRRKKKDE